jgi:cytochrome c554/c'-like protein
MKVKIVVGGLVLLIAVTVAACAQATTTAPPTASPPPPTPIPATATLPPPTPAPPTATLPPTPTMDPHVAGADCAKCHTEEHKRWATTLHAADPAAVLLNEEHDKTELLTDECITCHAPFQAAQYHIGDFVQPLDQKGPWHVVEANVKAWQAIKCEVCHDPTSSALHKLAFYDPAKQAYVPVKDSTELCEKCHQPGTDDSRDLKGSVHEGLQCATCHFQKGTEMSLDPHQSCAQCHPKANPKHPDVTQLDTTFLSADSKNDIHFLTCATCHPQGTPTPTP